METYEEKYKDLVKRLNKAREEKGVYTFNSVLDAVAPELKESEDERIRKKLIEAVKGDMVIGGTKDKQLAIAWLEKQGEKGTNGNEREIPNSAWSEEDEYYCNIILYTLNNECVGKTDKENAISWFKSIKDRVQTKPKQEWSEEDEKNISKIIDTLHYTEKTSSIKPISLYSKEINWLKSLRPQSQWKPSKEQMVAINTAINVLGKGTLNGKQLIKLQEQLKKLKGEEV